MTNDTHEQTPNATESSVQTKETEPVKEAAVLTDETQGQTLAPTATEIKATEAAVPTNETEKQTSDVPTETNETTEAAVPTNETEQQTSDHVPTGTTTEAETLAPTIQHVGDDGDDPATAADDDTKDRRNSTIDRRVENSRNRPTKIVVETVYSDIEEEGKDPKGDDNGETIQQIRMQRAATTFPCPNGMIAIGTLPQLMITLGAQLPAISGGPIIEEESKLSAEEQDNDVESLQSHGSYEYHSEEEEPEIPEQLRQAYEDNRRSIQKIDSPNSDGEEELEQSKQTRRKSPRLSLNPVIGCWVENKKRAFQFEDVDGDGHCLFHAFIKAAGLKMSSPHTLQTRIE